MSEVIDVAVFSTRSPAFHQAILDNMTTAAILLDAKLDIIYSNSAAEGLLAACDNRVIPRSLERLFGHDPQALQGFRDLLATAHPYTRRAFHLPGAHLTVDYSVNPIFLDQQPMMLLLEIVQLDHALRMSREEALISTHLATRTLIKGVAHEVKNPLGGIRGAAQLLARQLDQDHSKAHLRDYTDVIIAETDRLRALVDRMLHPHQPPQLRRCNIHHILEHVAQIIQAEYKPAILLARDYDVSLPEFNGDADQLIQAFLNIVGNAAQALQENAQQIHPCITLQTRVLRKLVIGGHHHRLAICIRIVDNGPGIPESLISTIFLPMISGRPSGTGLGLSIAQTILSQHHGLIECESTPGKTEFFIFIPLD
jgi:two-component system nitrogen regulation sensor histidine kinase GlnL